MILTGASGFIGNDLLRELKENYTIIAIGRTFKAANRHPHIQYCVGDLLQLGSNGAMAGLEGVRPDLFVHAAGQAHIAPTGDAGALFRRNNVSATEAALRLAVQVRARKFIHISSAVVYNHNPYDLYENSKREAEAKVIQICGENGIPYVIVRPAMVYGEHEPSGYTATLMRRVRRGYCLLPNGGTRPKPMIYIKNLSYLIRQAGEDGSCASTVVLARDRELLTLRDIYDHIQRSIGKTCTLIPVPAPIVKSVIIAVNLLNRAGFLKKVQVRSLRNLNVQVQYPMDESNERLVESLPYTAAQGWDATVASLRRGRFHNGTQ